MLKKTATIGLGVLVAFTQSALARDATYNGLLSVLKCANWRTVICAEDGYCYPYVDPTVESFSSDVYVAFDLENQVVVMPVEQSFDTVSYAMTNLEASEAEINEPTLLITFQFEADDIVRWVTLGGIRGYQGTYNFHFAIRREADDEGRELIAMGAC